jgi:DNA-binding CsgD family transcriptional regulator
MEQTADQFEPASEEMKAFTAWQSRRTEARLKLQILTSREMQIAVLTAHGINSRQAARTLGISVKTVEKHRASAYRRLDLSGVIGLVRLIILAERDEPTDLGEQIELAEPTDLGEQIELAEPTDLGKQIELEEQIESTSRVELVERAERTGQGFATNPEVVNT